MFELKDSAVSDEKLDEEIFCLWESGSTTSEIAEHVYLTEKELLQRPDYIDLLSKQ